MLRAAITLLMFISCLGYTIGLSFPDSAASKRSKVDSSALPRPSLSAIINSGHSTPQANNFHGLIVNETRSSYLHPLLNCLFFDNGSYHIPARYVLFKTAAEASTFRDTQIPGETLEKYYHLLNIIGYRLQNHPRTRIRIRGYYNPFHFLSPPQEDTLLARQRANAVYSYLHSIWGIEAHRMKVEYQVYPLHPLTPNKMDSLELQEYRRVEILSKDREILKPLLDRNPRVLPFPLAVRFVIKNGIADSLVAERRIIIRREAKDETQEWSSLLDSSTTHPYLEWDWKSSSKNLPAYNTYTTQAPKKIQELPAFSAHLLLRTIEGKEYTSDTLHIPIRYVVSPPCCSCETTQSENSVEKFLMLYPTTDTTPLTAYQQRFLKEYIYPRCFPSSQIIIIGHRDILHIYLLNQRFSSFAATQVEKAIRRHIKTVASISANGVGEDEPLYVNTLPEGRYYNRSVQIFLQTPVSDAKIKESILCKDKNKQ